MVSYRKNDASDTGTYIKAEAESVGKKHPEYCIRFSFEYGDKVSIYEPNSDGSNGGEVGTDKDCMNEIQAQMIVGQLKFVSHRKEN